MGRSKLYIVLAIITILTFLGTAAICNMCGIPPTTESATTTAGAPDEKTKEELIKEEEEAKLAEIESIKERYAKAKQEAIESEQQASSTTESGETGSTAGSNATAPTIRLEIYEGPTYSEAGDICVYKIEAIVTGSPTPTITFSRDDSNGTWGSGKVQINIQRSQSYTLSATAVNSAGSSTASMYLSWGCGNAGAAEEGGGEEEAPPEEIGGESGPTVLSMDIPVVVTEGGYITHDGDPISIGGNPYAGYSNTMEPIIGFISFDITRLPTPNVHTASLIFRASQIHGDPSFINSFIISSLYYGPVPINTNCFVIVWTTIQRINAPTSGNFTIDNEALKTELQRAIDQGQSRFQIAIAPEAGVTDYDNFWDGIEWGTSGITLSITYLH